MINFFRKLFRCEKNCEWKIINTCEVSSFGKYNYIDYTLQCKTCGNIKSKKV